MHILLNFRCAQRLFSWQLIEEGRVNVGQLISISLSISLGIFLKPKRIPEIFDNAFPKCPPLFFDASSLTGNFCPHPSSVLVRYAFLLPG